MQFRRLSVIPVLCDCVCWCWFSLPLCGLEHAQAWPRRHLHIPISHPSCQGTRCYPGAGLRVGVLETRADVAGRRGDFGQDALSLVYTQPPFN